MQNREAKLRNVVYVKRDQDIGRTAYYVASLFERDGYDKVVLLASGRAFYTARDLATAIGDRVAIDVEELNVGWVDEYT